MKFMSQIEFYHNLYVSECWQKKKGKIVKRLKENKLQPQVYVITLSQGEQNQLEFFSSVLLKQSIFEHSKLFVIGIADGYDLQIYIMNRFSLLKKLFKTYIKKPKVQMQDSFF